MYKYYTAAQTSKRLLQQVKYIQMKARIQKKSLNKSQKEKVKSDLKFLH